MKNHAQRLFQRSFHRPGFPMLVLTATAMCLFAPPAFNQAVEALTPPPASTVANIPAVPKLIKFSGIAVDGRGYPITVPVEVTFALYAQQGAANNAAIWRETQHISPNEKGAYTVYLGATQGLPAEVFTSVAAQYLGVSVDGEPEQARTLLVSVPYALESGDAQTLGGLPASAYALANGSKEGAVSANVSSVSTPVTAKAKTSNPAVTGKGISGAIPIWDSTSDIGNSAIYQLNGNVGIGTVTPSSPLDVFGQITAQNAIMVGNSITKGVRLRDTGAGLDLESFGAPLYVNWLTNNPTYFGAPAYFNTAIGVGTAVPQAQVNLNNQNQANADSLLLGNNTTKGLQMRDNGTGVDLESIGVPLYVNFLTKQPMNINSNGGFVNIGIATPPVSGQCTKNYGGCVSLPALLNVGAFPDGTGDFTSAYFSNDVVVGGNFLAQGTKNFRIDHPLDPTNKYLNHAAIESSEVLNQYSGNLVLDGNGEGQVAFPKWFAAINEDFRYQLTAIGAPGPNLHIAKEMEGSGFTVGGGAPGMKVSWQVTARRNDAYMKAHPFVVEKDKPEQERGYYTDPALYGAPKEMGVLYAHSSSAKPQ
jgi:hypothetical protein